MKKGVLSLLIASSLVGCTVYRPVPTETGLIGNPDPPTPIKHFKTCANDFDIRSNGKTVSILFDASPTLTNQIKQDLKKRGVKIVENGDKADMNVEIKSRMVAVKPTSKRRAYFEKLGTYYEDPDKKIFTAIYKGNAGFTLNVTPNPAGLVLSNVAGYLGSRSANKKAPEYTSPWVQGEGNLPDMSCKMSVPGSCQNYLFKNVVETTVTETKSGKQCVLDSSVLYYKVDPDLILPDHIKKIENHIAD